MILYTFSDPACETLAAAHPDNFFHIVRLSFPLLFHVVYDFLYMLYDDKILN